MEKEKIRVASSELISRLYGDTTKYENLIEEEIVKLISLYPNTGLNFLFKKMRTRVISIAPMVLCEAMLSDLKIQTPDNLLKGIGLASFHISTHDDVVDEMPKDRQYIANLIYAGNITKCHGIKILIESKMLKELKSLLDTLSIENLYQTEIVEKLWLKPKDEKNYLNAIITTRNWAYIGLEVALVFANNTELKPFIKEYSDYYGNLCQILDDMREIKEDIFNNYYSLPIVHSIEHKLDLSKKYNANNAIKRSRELIIDYISKSKTITDKKFPKLYEFIERIEDIGLKLKYHDNYEVEI